MASDIYERSVALHRKYHGKLEVCSRVPLLTTDDLALAYTPGVARPCELIAKNPNESFDLTMRGNSVAVLTDGTAVLGLGNIGPTAAMPVMEGKAALFKAFANIDAIPICANVTTDEELIAVARAIAPGFAGINLEDIAAPRCFVVEQALQNLGIPVFHDDQHGTAIVLMAALLNSAQVVGKNITDLQVVISGAGAAGTAIARILCGIDQDPQIGSSVREVLICDSKGIISAARDDLNPFKRTLLSFTNRDNQSGSLHDALKGADVFIGVSRGNLLSQDDVRLMADDSIIFAMANPIPEIMPEEALAAGAAIVGTGRSDYPNQVNNVLVFPGLFRGLLDARATQVTSSIKLAAAYALADIVEKPVRERVLPSVLDNGVAQRIAAAVAQNIHKTVHA